VIETILKDAANPLEDEQRQQLEALRDFVKEQLTKTIKDGEQSPAIALAATFAEFKADPCFSAVEKGKP
jgi:hypothetical protein